MLGYTAIAPLTMLAPQWHPHHTKDAKVLVIKLPQTQKLIDDSFLLSKTAKFGHISRFISHTTEVEIPAKGVKDNECDIAEWIR